jgi:glutathione S-transferase
LIVVSPDHRLRLARGRAILPAIEAGQPAQPPATGHSFQEPSMLKLHSSLASPFGRKVKVAALFTGHSDRLEILMTDTMKADDPVRKANPLGKIPCLVLEDGTSLFDSRVICEYLDYDAGGGKILPTEWRARIAVKRLEALADGITDACILRLYEGRFRQPEKHEPAWIAHQTGKAERGLAELEANPPVATATPDIGVIAVACMLEWFELRFKGLSGGAYPRLSAFLKDLNAAVPDFSKTAPKA